MPVATRSSSPALRIGLGAATAALVWVSWAGAGMRLSTLSNPLNVRGLLTFAEGVWPPDVSGLFLERVVNAVVQTLAMAIAGGALGCAAGLALGALGRMGRIGVVARGLSRVLAAVPDVVWALLLVVGFGPGPLAGALGLAVGATGRIARASRDWRATVLARFPLFVRSAAVMGFAGAGGIGREIDVSLRLLEPARTATLLFALLGMVLAVDAAVHLIERKLPVPPPRWLHLVWLILLPLALQQAGFIGILAPDLLPRFGALAVQVVPPDVSSLFVISLGEPAWHTVAISVVGTAIGVGLGTALARLRPVLAVLRAVPPLVWVALCVLAAGRGPLAGALALGLHGAGLPLRAPRLRSTLLRWRDNLAVASVVGIAGGGGIGAALANTVRLAFYDRTTSIVMAIVVLVSTVDALVDAWPAGSPGAATPLVVPVQAAPEK